MGTDYDNTPLTLEQALPTFDTHEGVPVASVGEDGDYVLLGHHDDEQTAAAIAGAYGLMDGDVELITGTQGWAQLTPHSGGCDPEEAKTEGCSCDEYGWWLGDVRTTHEAAVRPLPNDLAVTLVRA